MPALKLGNNGRGGGRYRPMAEINVTPLVDVMLVLLVIFMVAAPLLTVGVPVHLPETQAAPINEPKEPLVVTVNAQCQIFVQNTEVSSDSLVPRLKALTGGQGSYSMELSHYDPVPPRRQQELMQAYRPRAEEE